jgi:transposase InsO family protein
VSVARFIADQRTLYRVPHTVVCALLGVSLAWFYKWWGRAQTPAASSGLHTTRGRRRDSLDRAVRVMFTKQRGLHGSPRLHADLRADGWQVSEKTVADSMRRQGLIARRIRRRNGLTRQDTTAPTFPDLLKRDFTAPRPNARWVGDVTEIPTVDGQGRPGRRLYLATVIDLYSRRLLGAATSLHPDAQLACAALKMAVASRGGVAAVNGPAGARTTRSGSSSTPTGARPTRRRRSPRCAASWGSGSRWAGWGRASTTPPPRRSSPSWSGRCCHDTSSPPPAKPKLSCWTGATGSTTTAAGTPRRA